MRPIIALVISTLLFTGVYAYTQFAESVRREPLKIQANFSSGTYSLEIVRTFDCVADEGWADVNSLLVKFRGQDIISRTDMVSTTEKIVVDPLENVEQKENEIFVSANLKNAGVNGWEDELGDNWGGEKAADSSVSSTDTASTGALRVVVKRGDEIVADETFWLESGALKIDASVSFEAPVENFESDHDH